MTAAYLQLVEHLAVVRNAWKTRRAFEAGMLTLAVAAIVLTAVAVCDHVGTFGYAGRTVLSLVFWGCIFTAAWQAAKRGVFAKHDDDFFAALIERALPESRNRFINAFQLGREPSTDAPRIVEAIVNEGVSSTDELEPSRAVVQPATRRNALALGGAVAVAVCYWLIAGPGAWTSMARVLLPTANIQPFAWTKVVVTPGSDLRVLEGSVLAVKAETSGRVPETAVIHWKVAGRRFGQRMAPGQGGIFTHNFDAVQTDMSFRIHAGDAWSRETLVTVDPRPRIEEMNVEYTPPPYTGIAAHVPEMFDGHLRGLPKTVAHLRFSVNKPLARLRMILNGSVEVPTRQGKNASSWDATLEIRESGTYRLILDDTQGYKIEDPSLYTIVLKQDEAPRIVFVRPAVDMGLRPGEKVEFRIAAQDDFGLARMVMRAVVNNTVEPIVVQNWDLAGGTPHRSHEARLEKTLDTLGLTPGDRMRYWAEAIDRNDVADGGPGRASTRQFTLVALSPEQAEKSFDTRLRNYVQIIGEMIRLQRLNRAETASFENAPGLISRQVAIRAMGNNLASQMERDAFPAQTLVQNLRELLTGPMVDVIAQLESYRDVTPREKARSHAGQSLPVQDHIIATLEEFLIRLERAVLVRHRLKKIEREMPDDHGKVLETIDKLAADLEKFLGDVRDLDQDFERLAKREDKDVFADEPELLEEAAQRIDRWKQWFADSVDAITKLPQGFVDDSYLAESLRAISEEIEKKPRKPTVEIATPIEEGAKALGTEMMEDFEMWTPDRGDNLRWVMEDPVEGIFEVPEEVLSSDLQDIIGKLIEDMEEFDEAADDVTGAWGGNLQMGWGIMDGPISSY
ncbi:MAG: hypothetical protein HQ559_14420, partial [Lentisphaerae bacterium]|nr:hypothetical protein [Lentisphaerota bacterium]